MSALLGLFILLSFAQVLSAYKVFVYTSQAVLMRYRTEGLEAGHSELLWACLISCTWPYLLFASYVGEYNKKIKYVKEKRRLWLRLMAALGIAIVIILLIGEDFLNAL